MSPFLWMSITMDGVHAIITCSGCPPASSLAEDEEAVTNSIDVLVNMAPHINLTPLAASPSSVLQQVPRFRWAGEWMAG